MAMEQPEQAELKWVSESEQREEEEEEEEVVGLQPRRFINDVHGENEFITSEKDQDDVPHFITQNQKILVKESHEDQSSTMILNKEVEDLDVEGVLEKQETYDLICPHCHHDITKKVILRRRGTTHEEDITTTDPEAPNPNKDVFLCSACLRFFTRLGRDCFAKIDCFSLFGGEHETVETVQDPLQHNAGSVEEPLTQTETSIAVGEPLVAVASEVGEWGILKSVVYGGLAESITSLGIVSSVAGAAAATLNIMVLALANLIGGLIIISHNLLELRNNINGGSSSDRYHETLGPRDKYKLHVVTVMLSFLIFGAIPPIVYGFSFRESDDKELKLAVMAASSLVCIALLAAGKARVQSAPKSCFKTVLYYVVVGFVASGVSYVAGVLFDRLLKYLGLFESSSATNVFIQETKLGQQGLAYH